ncbi:MAG TPA: hypothetical protein VFA18_14775, partial [Gemmataceae bacterium]|nr:hypothetical protein [Gemmataceae bacterium]
MSESRWTVRLFDCVWFLVWAVGSSAWCLTAAGQLGATFDEPIYVREGLQVWRTGSHHGLMKLGTMPLPVDVITLPLHLMEEHEQTQFDADADMARLLPVARAGTLVFWWLLLLYARIAAGQLGGAWAGRLALAWIACEPNFLAHASLATTDICVTAFLLALVYHFRTGRDGGWVRRLAIPAFWFGAAVLAKASGLVFGCLCLFAVEVEYLARRGAFHVPADVHGFQRVRFYLSQFKPFFRDCRWIVAGGFVLVFVFVGSDWQVQRSFVVWADSLPDGQMARAMSWLAHHLTIFSNAAEGLARQVGHNVRGHGVYLLGKTDRRAFWYYFPVIMAIKLTLPLLLAPLALLLAAPRTLTTWPCAAVAALLLFTPLCRVQIGIRFMLPLMALAIGGLAA